jgi:hypothetical protein
MPDDTPPFDIREQLARIDRELAEHDQPGRTIHPRQAGLALWVFALIGIGAGAALFGAGMAFMKLFV